MTTKFQRHLAIVLRRTNYGETDRIVNFITPAGQVSVLAKGVRKQGSKLAGGLELFCLSDIVATGNQKLARLTSAKLVTFYSEIIKDYDRLQLAYRLLKLVDQYSRGIVDEAWFDLTRQGLEHLNQATDLRLIEAWVYLRLANLTGEELNLSTDIDGVKLASGQTYSYDWTNKGLIASSTGQLTTDHLKLLRLLAVGDLDLSAKVNQADGLLDGVRQVAFEHLGVSY